ncbi:MAG TPA: hypothetical protein P5110_05250 [Candidatus Omnitrophota bacterium]|nr:hypothetical protein [Candidatus Omnitrophota bacterium]
MKKKEDLNFEIAFFEGVLSFAPDFTEALFCLGDAYSKKGRFEEGLIIDLRLNKLLPADETARYNLACDYSLLKQPDACLAALHQAIELGYRDFSFMHKDPDLAFIRTDPRYQQLLARWLTRERGVNQKIQ